MDVIGSAAGADQHGEIDRLAEEFIERRRRGERPTIDEYAAAHPGFADEIREIFGTLLIVENLGDPTGAEPMPVLGQATTALSSQPPGLQQVGDYRILRELGRGGMGIVYEAEQESLGRRVALKVLPFHSLLDPKQIERFQQEARAAARLTHPNIVPVYGVGEHLGMHYYVMQLIPGQGVDRVIEEVRRLRAQGEAEPATKDPSSSTSLATALEAGSGRSGRERYYRNVARLARDAALALDAAHGQGVLHRDIKPSNLLLDPAGRVWLTDFGLAKAEGTEDLTGSEELVGTLRYMAPERFKGWSDPRSDVYGLGITLYELLTLQPAFSARDRARLLRKVSSEEPPLPRKIDGTIPRDLETIVLKSIAKEPSQRYATARRMAEDLDRFLDGRALEARRSTAVGKLRRWCLRNPLLASLLLIVMLLLAAVAGVSSTMAVRLKHERDRGLEQLRASHVSQAGALRRSGLPGRRFDALAAIRKAAEIRLGPDLVDEALACFAEVDVRPSRAWAQGENEGVAIAPDRASLARGEPTGEVAILSAEGERAIARLPGPGFQPDNVLPTFSPDGRFLAVRYHSWAAQPQRIEWRIWDLDRRVVAAEVKDAYSPQGIGFSPDGTWAAVATVRRGVWIVDLATGKTRSEIGRRFPATGLAIHPAGRLIAVSQAGSNRVHVLDREEDRNLRVLEGDENPIFSEVAWHPDGRTLAAASYDHRIYLWNAETGRRTRLLLGHEAETTGIAFSANGTLLCSQSWDTKVRFWDAGSDRPVFSIPGREGGFTAKADSIWTRSAVSMQLWDVAAARHSFALFGHEGRTGKHPNSISLSPDGRLAATTGVDGVLLWDLSSRVEVARLVDSKFTTAAFDAQGATFYAGGTAGLFRWPIRAPGRSSDDRTLARAQRVTIGPVERVTSLEAISGVALCDAGALLAVAHQSTHAHIFDSSQPERAVFLRGLPDGWDIALSPDGALVAAGSWRAQEALVWNAQNGQVVRRLAAGKAHVAFDPSGENLATCGVLDCTLWRTSDWKPVWRIPRSAGLALGGHVAFDRTGTTAAMTYDSSRIWVVDAATGRKLAGFEAPESRLLTGINLQGNVLVGSTGTQRFHVWDLSGLAWELKNFGLQTGLSARGVPLVERHPLRVAVLERSLELLDRELLTLASWDLFRPHERVLFLRELASYAEIDQILGAPKVVIPEGDAWKIFRGRKEPASDIEWTALAHDDGKWERGRSQFTSWELKSSGRPKTDPMRPATQLADQIGSYTTLYLRHEFDVADPAAVSRVVLACEIEDGLVAYLNGQEIGRVNAGDPEEWMPFDAVARRRDRFRTTEAFEASPTLLHQGRNVIAIQALTYGLDSHLHVLPVLAVVPAADPERDRRRTENLARTADGAADPSLLAYREGRLHQRGGRLREALAEFERCRVLDPGAAEPVLRRMACHRALGESQQAADLARAAIKDGDVLENGRLWRAWIKTMLVDLRRSPSEAIAELPRSASADASSAAEDHKWLLEQLAAGQPLRIHCGGGEQPSLDRPRDGEMAGVPWGRDRFAVTRSPVALTEEAAPPSDVGAKKSPGRDRIVRRFPGKAPFRSGYSIPLPPGHYRVTLQLSDLTLQPPGARIFDVILEGTAVVEGYDPGRAGLTALVGRSADLDVTDGFLEIDFLAHKGDPQIAAIELVRLGDASPKK